MDNNSNKEETLLSYVTAQTGNIINKIAFISKTKKKICSSISKGTVPEQIQKHGSYTH